MDERPPEICDEARVGGLDGASVQRWWSHREQAELLRFTRRPVEQVPAHDELVTEAELVGLLDSAWDGGLLSDFAKRQLFQLMMRRYEADSEGL